MLPVVLQSMGNRPQIISIYTCNQATSELLVSPVSSAGKCYSGGKGYSVKWTYVQGCQKKKQLFNLHYNPRHANTLSVTLQCHAVGKERDITSFWTLALLCLSRAPNDPAQLSDARLSHRRLCSARHQGVYFCPATASVTWRHGTLRHQDQARFHPQFLQDLLSNLILKVETDFLHQDVSKPNLTTTLSKHYRAERCMFL